jgi:type I restriction enzyme S subunit
MRSKNGAMGKCKWPQFRLGEVCDVVHGFAFKGQYFCDTPSDYLLVTPGNFAIGGGFQTGKPKYYKGPVPKDYILARGDLIVTMTDLSKQGDTLGYSALVPKNDKYLHNQRIGLVTMTSKHVLTEYIYWLMRTKNYQKYIVNHSSGSTVKHTSPKLILSYEINLPPLPTQRAIAATLSCFDDKIALNHRINANLEAHAQAIFKSWFVDFEPFKGGKFVDSELGQIPKGWRVGSLENLGFITGGATPSKEKSKYFTMPGNGISWITPKDLSVNKDKFISFGESDITNEGYKNSSTKLMPKGTVLFSSRAPIGYLAIANKELCTNQGFKSVIPNNDIGTAYVYYYLKTNLDIIENHASGSTFKEISGNTMKNITALIPDKDVLSKFSDLCSQIFKLQERNEAQSRTLAAIRDTLLPKLMSGEIEAEK